MAKVEKAVNVASRSRPVSNPYASWTEPGIGGKYLLIKSHQVDNGKPLARWHVYADGEFAEYGDMYVNELRESAFSANNLTFDTSIWPDREAFEAWAYGRA